MGEAKHRGTFEQRAENAKGDSWRPIYWTEERLMEFKERMSNELCTCIDKVRGDLFTQRKLKKKRFRKIKTGG
jgi:hypothetical protein